MKNLSQSEKNMLKKILKNKGEQLIQDAIEAAKIEIVKDERLKSPEDYKYHTYGKTCMTQCACIKCRNNNKTIDEFPCDKCCVEEICYFESW